MKKIVSILLLVVVLGLAVQSNTASANELINCQKSSKLSLTQFKNDKKECSVADAFLFIFIFSVPVQQTLLTIHYNCIKKTRSHPYQYSGDFSLYEYISDCFLHRYQHP